MGNALVGKLCASGSLMKLHLSCQSPQRSRAAGQASKLIHAAFRLSSLPCGFLHWMPKCPRGMVADFPLPRATSQWRLASPRASDSRDKGRAREQTQEEPTVFLPPNIKKVTSCHSCHLPSLEGKH